MMTRESRIAFVKVIFVTSLRINVVFCPEECSYILIKIKQGIVSYRGLFYIQNNF